MSKKTFKIAIVAGEASGDLLGARLIQACHHLHADIEFEGIAGPEMQEAGCHSLYPMEKLSVMGFSEVLSHLPSLLKIRSALVKRWSKNPPDLMIGIDAPDFNLALEGPLKRKGIPTLHYVSPSVWAWREKRVNKIKHQVDIMMTLFPFEVDFYRRHGISAKFVGHPLADEIEPYTEKRDAKRKQLARERLGLDQDAYYLALLPGSRIGEIQRLTPDFLIAMTQITQNHPEIRFVVPLINNEVRTLFNTIKQKHAPNLPISLIDKQAHHVMAASDSLLMASGTAVLEGMLIGRLMIAAYRVAPTTAFVVRTLRMIQAKHYTLPNNLAREELVPELIQEAVTPESIIQTLEAQWALSEERQHYILQRFTEIHLQLRQNASQSVAKIVFDVLQNGLSKQGEV